MRTSVSLDSRIRGCLTGAAIGAELGFARCVEPERFKTARPKQMFEIELTPVRTYRPTPHRTDLASTAAFVNVGVRTYLKSKGRATPEVFGALLKDDEGVAAPIFMWDCLHTIQEILKESMNPRISGMAAAPCGLICAAMPAVGVYHFVHPDYAYLDGVELASTAQPRLGADWAGLCAAAVAAAFEPESTGQGIVDSVLKIAFENSRSLFFALDRNRRIAQSSTEKEFLNAWHQRGGAPDPSREALWIGYNPISFILPLVDRYAQDPERLMTLLVAGPPFMYTTTVSAVIGGAIVGAMHGQQAFPRKWRRWAEPIARPWFGLADVVGRRVRKEARIIAMTERLAETDEDGDSLLKEKIRGCILAGAIGNAMGSPVEGRMYFDIDKQYPKGITTILEPSRLETEDDNQMAMLLVETYLAREGQPVMARHFGKTWRERLNRNHFYTLCMGHAYDRICGGWDPRIVGHWAVVTGSTVMCMEPVGIYHMADPEFAAIDATAVSYMYQRGLDVTAATMLVATVAEAFRPEATVESVCNAALAAAPKEKFRTFDRRPFKSCHDYIRTCLDIADKYTDVLAVRAELYDKCLLYHMIDPLELWGISLAMFKIAHGDVRQAAIGGTNIGRDSDTIAGRAAMLAGTLSGVKNVPEEWIAMFKPAVLDKIYRNADRFADLVATRKLSRLKIRQAVASR